MPVHPQHRAQLVAEAAGPQELPVARAPRRAVARGHPQPGGRDVGPGGRVTGIDVDAALGAQAIALHAAGHGQCIFEVADIERDDEEISGAPLWSLLVGAWKRNAVR